MRKSASQANWFLEQMIDLADKPLDDEVVRYILAQGPAQDGGQVSTFPPFARFANAGLTRFLEN